MKLLLIILVLILFGFVLSNDCKCRMKTKNKVVNGQFAVKNSIPWIVSLAYREFGEHFCGGSIINEKYILTASHCIDDVETDQIIVGVGIHNFEEEILESQIYNVKKIYQKQFESTKKPGDIAILKLDKNISFVDGKIEKGCFNFKKREYSQPLLAAGWGMTKQSYIDLETNKWVLSGDADQLKQVFYKQKKNCRDFLICLSPVNKEDSICQGDSGGPLHYTKNGITTIEGVASFVSGSRLEGKKKYYCIGDASYSRLSYYADWIRNTTKHNFCKTHEKK